VVIVGAEHLGELFSGRVYDAKMVFNERGAIVFPATRQHCEMKAEGISYEDNYTGNALAAMLRRTAIEIRFHRAFDDRTVGRILNAMLVEPALACFATAQITYQGRAIVLNRSNLSSRGSGQSAC
jgi:hypothetical protein